MEERREGGEEGWRRGEEGGRGTVYREEGSKREKRGRDLRIS